MTEALASAISAGKSKIEELYTYNKKNRQGNDTVSIRVCYSQTLTRLDESAVSDETVTVSRLCVRVPLHAIGS